MKSNQKSASTPGVCPTCGQSLVDPSMRDRVERAQAKADKAALGKARAEIESDVAARHEAAHAAEISRMKGQVDQLKRRLEKQSNHDRGTSREHSTAKELQGAFPEDRVETTGSRGGDVIQTVVYRGEEIGQILFECKDTGTWQSKFVAKVKEDGRKRGTPYLFLLTHKLPAKAEAFLVRDGVIICQPAYAVHLAGVVRRMVLEIHRAGVQSAERPYKAQRLLEYLSGREYRDAFNAILEAATALSEQLISERNQHERGWRTREQFHSELIARTHGVNDAVEQILEEGADAKGHRELLDLLLEMPEFTGELH